MLIQTGIKHKKIFGIRLRAKGPSFHKEFGSLDELPGDFNLDANLYPAFCQNNPNTLFDTPAQPEGCTGMTTAGVMTDVLKIPVSPWYSYKQTCLAEGVSTNSPLEMAYALNEPVISGLQVFGETESQALNRKTPPWWEVKPLNGSMFRGLVSAMVVGGAPISFAGTYYESYDNPVNGILPTGTGQSDGHNYEVCGLKRVNGVPYLIANLWLGASWGGGNGLRGGYCLISEAEINAQNGQGFTPKESPDASLPAPITTENIIESLIHFMQTLVQGYGGTTPAFTVWDVLEQEEQVIQKELTPMETNEQKMYNAAKDALGKVYTLDPSTPAELRCAEAWSDIARHAEVTGIPDTGFENTDQVEQFLSTSGQFELITTPEEGATVIAISKVVNGVITEHGHVTVCGGFNTQYVNDWGLISNDSSVGQVHEQWGYKSFVNCYTGLGLSVKIYRRS